LGTMVFISDTLGTKLLLGEKGASRSMP
jgi:hypothetical protein